MSESTGFRVYPPGERPDVEVRAEDVWLPAEIRSWSQRPSGWWANCSYHPATGETQLGTFHARKSPRHREHSPVGRH